MKLESLQLLLFEQVAHFIKHESLYSAQSIQKTQKPITIPQNYMTYIYVHHICYCNIVSYAILEIVTPKHLFPAYFPKGHTISSWLVVQKHYLSWVIPLSKEWEFSENVSCFTVSKRLLLPCLWICLVTVLPS